MHETYSILYCQHYIISDPSIKHGTELIFKIVVYRYFQMISEAICATLATSYEMLFHNMMLSRLF